MVTPQPGKWEIAFRTNGLGSRLIARKYTTPELAGLFGGALKAPVRDATKLTAKYDFTLTYSGGIEPGKALNSPQPDLFSAVQSQLGLRLEPGKVGVPVMVVDHMARMPNGN